MMPFTQARSKWQGRRTSKYWRALREHRILVTLDADFHARLALSKAKGPSVIRVRIEGLCAGPLAELVQDVLQQSLPELKTGAMISVQEHRIRIRHLPIE